MKSSDSDLLAGFCLKFSNLVRCQVFTVPETSANPFQMSRANYRIHAARAISPIRFAPQVYQIISVIFKAVNNGVSAEAKFTIELTRARTQFQRKAMVLATMRIR